ncbi:Proteasome activator complex subunit 4 [Phytophthora boehmeriae]|uniref:Proteasome activator complex subunit 4 n=1 Tax=Phytophthora boehmeriae TaxID=109152 RepID=A0A8T1W9Z0_9STRA|nr:Proteasome activator complex subunit 4 [Phytophthora boehmeriae]
MASTSEPPPSEALHPYYRLLPSYITPESIHAEHQDFISRIQESLNCLRSLHNEDPPTITLQKRHFRDIDTLFKLKHELPAPLHAQLIHILVELLWTHNGRSFVDVDMEIRAIEVLQLLLEKWKKRRRSEDVEEIFIDWRSARRAVERVCFRESGSFQLASQSYLTKLATLTVKCAEVARSFYHASDPNVPFVVELWAEFGVTIKEVKTTECFRALALFSFFLALPGSEDLQVAEQKIVTLLPDWFSTWTLISRCGEWDGHWMKILSRVAKKFPSTSILNDYFPFLYAKVTDILELPSDLGAPFKKKSWPSVYSSINGSKRLSQHAMRLCVYLLGDAEVDGADAAPIRYLLEILSLLKSFFHPSNVANIGNSLSTFTYYLSNSLGKRHGNEKKGATGLQVNSVHKIVVALQEICFLGIYSNNQGVATKCMYVLKNLLCIDPAHCVAPVMEEMLKALDPMAMSHSHLAVTAISSMAVFSYQLMCGQHPESTGLFFSTYLKPILELTLPGIDANDEKKTQSTLQLYFRLLSWLPLINDPAKGHFQATKQRREVSNQLFVDMEKSLFAEIAPLGSEIDEQMWEIGPFLEEWALAVLDRCFQFIQSRSGARSSSSSTDDSRSNNGKSSNKEGSEDAIVLQVLNLLSMLYDQMSPEIYQQAVRKTVTFVSNVFYTTSFGRKIHKLVVYWRENGSGNAMEIQVWRVLLNIMSQLLIWRGEHLDEFGIKENQNLYSKITALDVPSHAYRKIASTIDHMPKEKLVPLLSRNDLVEKVIFFYSKRKRVLNAVLNNHKNSNRFAASADGQHAESAPSDWSFGVSEFVRYITSNSQSYPKAAPLSSMRLLNQSSETFGNVSLSNVKLVQKLVQENPTAFVESGAIGQLRNLADENIGAEVAEEDRQAALKTLADWITAVLHALAKIDIARISEEEISKQITSFVELLKTILPQVSIVLIDQWVEVAYLIFRPSRSGSVKLVRLKLLMSYLLQELEVSFTRATAEDYARQAKWLALVESMGVHLLAANASASDEAIHALASAFNERVLTVIRQHALTHQYKIIRDRVGKMLFLLGAYVSRAEAPVDMSALPLDQLLAASALPGEDVDNEQESGDSELDESLHAKETAMQWLSCCEKFGDVRDALAVLNELLPIALLAQSHQKAEVAVQAKNASNAVSLTLRMYFVPQDSTGENKLNNLLELLERLSTSRVWKTRGAVLRFTMTISFYHWVFLSSELKQRVHRFVCTFLTDKQREVQAMAKYALRGLIHNEQNSVVEAMSLRLREATVESRVKFLKLKRRSKRQEADSALKDELKKTQDRLLAVEEKMMESVLSLSAIVLAFPHDVPSFVPPIFEELGPFLYMKKSSNTISFLEKAVKETLLDFKRTHQDNWLEIKSKFTQPQLDVIEDVAIAPSYFS